MSDAEKASRLTVFFLYSKLRAQALGWALSHRFLRPRRHALWAAAIIFCVSLCTWYAWDVFPLRHFARSSMKDFLGSYFLAAGAAIFGLPAISFSLQSLVIQNTAENRSAGLYEIEGKDRVPTALFILLAVISIGFFFLAAWVDEASLYMRKAALVGSFPVIAGALWALFGLYRHTFWRLSPTKVIERVEMGIRADLRRMARLAKEYGIVLQQQAKDPLITQQVAEAAIYQRMAPRLRQANRRIEFLFDYHDKLLAAQERFAAREVLSAIRRILLEYLRARSGSSVRYIVGMFGAATSDSQDFLISDLEDLALRGKRYVRDGDDRGVTHVIEVFRDIVVGATDVRFYPEMRGSNPIFSQCRGYFEQIVEEAIKQSSTEALFQCVRALRDMGVAALQAKLPLEFRAIIQKQLQIGICAAREHDLSVVWSESVSATNAWMQRLLAEDFISELDFAEVLEKWITLVVYGLRNGRQDPTLFGTPLAMPLLLIAAYAQRLHAKVQEDGDDAASLRSMLLNIIAQLKTKFYDFAEHAKSSTHPVIAETARLIGVLCDILQQLIDDAPSEYEQREPKELLRILLYMPARFIQHGGKADGIYGSFEALIDTVVQVGLRAYERGDEATVKESVKITTSIATDIATERICTYGLNNAPSVMAKACYIGILALKDGKTELARYVKEQVVAFQATLGASQEEAMGALSLADATKRAADTMYCQIAELRDEKQKYHDPRELMIERDAVQKKFLEKVEVIDIDRFTLEIWNGVHPASELCREEKEAPAAPVPATVAAATS